MVAVATEEGLFLLQFADSRTLETQLNCLKMNLESIPNPSHHCFLEKTNRELQRYFRGNLTTFSVPLVINGSDFQRSAWDFLRRIPYGETRSYKDQAQAIGRPDAQRAVGCANSSNRLTILIPCHRIICSNGSMSGYAGEVWRKRFLLDLERKQHSLRL